MFHGYLSCCNGFLERGDVAEDEDDDNGECHGGKEKPVLDGKLAAVVMDGKEKDKKERKNAPESSC